MQISGKKVAIVAANGFEQSELEIPRDRLVSFTRGVQYGLGSGKVIVPGALELAIQIALFARRHRQR